VLEQEPDHALDGGAQVGQGQGRGHVIVQVEALAAGYVDELAVIVAPVVLGGGKRLFDGFTQSLDLEHLGIQQSRYATFIHYRVKRPA
jgi:dihydrofolate reductase